MGASPRGGGKFVVFLDKLGTGGDASFWPVLRSGVSGSVSGPVVMVLLALSVGELNSKGGNITAGPPDAGMAMPAAPEGEGCGGTAGSMDSGAGAGEAGATVEPEPAGTGGFWPGAVIGFSALGTGGHPEAGGVAASRAAAGGVCAGAGSVSGSGRNKGSFGAASRTGLAGRSGVWPVGAGRGTAFALESGSGAVAATPAGAEAAWPLVAFSAFTVGVACAAVLLAAPGWTGALAGAGAALGVALAVVGAGFAPEAALGLPVWYLGVSWIGRPRPWPGMEGAGGA